MPCNIGYKTYAPIRIPQPQKFKKKMPAPKIDQELLDKIGVNDPEFLSWMIQELDVKPLLQEALKKALDACPTKAVEFSVTDDGYIAAEGQYKSREGLRRVEAATGRVLNRWQIEVLATVAQLLGYDTQISETENNDITLVAEEEGKTHPCKYIRVSKDSSGSGVITFEHFASATDLENERVKFTGLAQKLGIKIALNDSPITGKPISGGIEQTGRTESKEAER